MTRFCNEFIFFFFFVLSPFFYVIIKNIFQGLLGQTFSDNSPCDFRAVILCQDLPQLLRKLVSLKFVFEKLFCGYVIVLSWSFRQFQLLSLFIIWLAIQKGFLVTTSPVCLLLFNGQFFYLNEFKLMYLLFVVSSL